MGKTKRTIKNARIPAAQLERVAGAILAVHAELTPTTDEDWDRWAVAVNRRWPGLRVGRGRERCEAVVRRCAVLHDPAQAELRRRVRALRGRHGKMKRDRFADLLGMSTGGLIGRLGGHAPFSRSEAMVVDDLYAREFPQIPPPPAPVQQELPAPPAPVMPSADPGVRERALAVFHRLLTQRADAAHAAIMDMAVEGSETALRFLEREAGFPVGD